MASASVAGWGQAEGSSTPEADFLAHLERRREEAQRRFDDLARRARVDVGPGAEPGARSAVE